MCFFVIHCKSVSVIHKVHKVIYHQTVDNAMKYDKFLCLDEREHKFYIRMRSHSRV